MSISSNEWLPIFFFWEIAVREDYIIIVREDFFIIREDYIIVREDYMSIVREN